MAPGQTVVLITGASSGIGEATARLFADEGFRVFGTYLPMYRDASGVEKLAVAGVEMVELDVHSDDSVQRCVDEVLTRAGRIDVLLNNAGVMQVGFAEETSAEEAYAVFETNFFGAVRMIKAVLPEMRRNRQGRIVNIGSLAAWIGEPGQAVYSASKRSLAGYTEALHYEVGPLGIRVSLVEPGLFRTGILGAALIADGAIGDYDASRENAIKTLTASSGRGHDPQQLSRLLLKIVNSPSPRLRYGAGFEAHWLPYIKVLLPQRLFSRILRRAYGLPKK
ncbi:SDR family NAD(P)-dependent oxidoreductase [Actinomadura sp. 3N407]|uniref:SDR family NAD(P)-dependent oxidoreductase n=1 Tax=Actinomadura sp. 3N407 TaxID=3457423 RepID=UPI003FCC6883